MSFLSLILAFSRIFMATFSFVRMCCAIFTLPKVPLPRDLPVQKQSKRIVKKTWILTNYVVPQFGALSVRVACFNCSRALPSGWFLVWRPGWLAVLAPVGGVGIVFGRGHALVVLVATSRRFHLDGCIVGLAPDCRTDSDCLCLLLVMVSRLLPLSARVPSVLWCVLVIKLLVLLVCLESNLRLAQLL